MLTWLNPVALMRPSSLAPPEVSGLRAPPVITTGPIRARVGIRWAGRTRLSTRRGRVVSTSQWQSAQPVAWQVLIVEDDPRIASVYRKTVAGMRRLEVAGVVT